MTGTTFSGNTGTFGAGINNNNIATLTVINSTFSGNTTATNGGGIYRATGTVQLINTIISGNTASVSGTDCEGSLTSLGHNLIGNDSRVRLRPRHGRPGKRRPPPRPPGRQRRADPYPCPSCRQPGHRYR